MDTVETKIENNRYRNQCRDRITCSKFPKELKATLHAILSYIGPASYYTLSWASAQTIADHLGTARRTIERHIQVLVAVNLIERKIISVAVARRLLKEQFNH